LSELSMDVSGMSSSFPRISVVSSLAVALLMPFTLFVFCWRSTERNRNRCILPSWTWRRSSTAFREMLYEVSSAQ
uniref:Secreted protein n=1 Tax=Heligmosomoides polygyrus TaxID=6339 RepID=A0A183G1S5_HELPZ